jgi:DNA-binding response OmpR family regulator
MNSILLVDDEAAICVEFARTLEGLGFKVEVATTAESGLFRAETARFDVILVEFNVRSKRGRYHRSGNGLKVIRQLRVAGMAMPILMFTAMEGEFYERVSFDAGADDFILKTASIPSVVSRLRAQICAHERCSGKRTEAGTVSIRSPMAAVAELKAPIVPSHSETRLASGSVSALECWKYLRFLIKEIGKPRRLIGTQISTVYGNAAFEFKTIRIGRLH